MRLVGAKINASKLERNTWHWATRQGDARRGHQIRIELGFVSRRNDDPLLALVEIADPETDLSMRVDFKTLASYIYLRCELRSMLLMNKLPS